MGSGILLCTMSGPPKLHRKALENRVAAHLGRGQPELARLELLRFAATRCGARTRRGTSCQRKALANSRCPNHGGLSTGPKTPEGRRRALMNLKQYRDGGALPDLMAR